MKKSETEYEQRCVIDAGKSMEFLDSIRLHSSIQGVEPTADQLKVLHACVRKVTEDLEWTAIQHRDLRDDDFCLTRRWVGAQGRVSVLRPFLQLLAPFAPHIAEELWNKLEQQPKEKRALQHLR
jgi:leucyl-tRNA synthetase